MAASHGYGRAASRTKKSERRVRIGALISLTSSVWGQAGRQDNGCRCNLFLRIVRSMDDLPCRLTLRPDLLSCIDQLRARALIVSRRLIPLILK